MDVCPFQIVIDTREQAPFSFEGLELGKHSTPMKVETVRHKLDTGDYSIVGYENRICIERKSISDLVSTIFHDRDRFIQELKRMQHMDFSAIMVEADWKDVLYYCALQTQANPVSLDNTIIAWQCRYKTQWFFRPSRYTAMKTTWKLLDRYYRDQMEKGKHDREKQISDRGRQQSCENTTGVTSSPSAGGHR